MKSAFSKAIMVGSIMSLSAKDPIFRAALAVANQDIKGYAPRAWLEAMIEKSIE
jgi:hypothetical protein